jgi:hypothetical protein
MNVKVVNRLGVMKLLKKIKHRRQEFGARMAMERQAQKDTSSRLEAIEMRYRIESRKQDGSLDT